MAMDNNTDTKTDIKSLWDFDDPARSEAVFRERLATARGDDALSLQTQVARSHGLRGRFDEAHALLDRIEPQLAGAGAEPRVRHLLERGRTWRSAKQRDRARPLFLQAVELALAAKLDELAVDAMHMAALVEPDEAAQMRWNERALALALASDDPNARSWDASLAHNIGMTQHSAGRYDEALASFRTALAARERLGQADRARVGRWMIAWTLRFLKRHDEALAMQQALAAEFAALGRPDGFVFEEMGENLRALGRPDEAKLWFGRAAETLATLGPLERPDDEHLARLRALAR